MGTAFQDCAAVVVNPEGSPVGTDGSGELWLGGAQVTAGYLDNAEQNADKFVERAVEGYPYETWYRTGDVVRRDAEHGLVFEGRVDDQIKIQGYRAELLDVEEALRRASGSAEVAAVAWPVSDDGAAEGVVGFVCRSDRSAQDIVMACRSILPSYMVPKRIISIDSLPLNANGKVDRKALRSAHLAVNA